MTLKITEEVSITDNGTTDHTKLPTRSLLQLF